MKLNIQITGLKEVQSELKNFSERRLNAAVATALTRTAVQVREKVKTSILARFDRPTPYTMGQLKYVAANAKNLTAVVGLNVAKIQDQRGNTIRYQDLGPGETPAGKYLGRHNIAGGPRRNKRFEKALQSVGVLPSGWYAVPGERAKIDAYGNQSVGEIRQILAWFNAAELVAGSSQNMTDATREKRKKGTKKKAGFGYFFMPVGGKRAGPRPGIYRKTYFALGTRLEPIIIFVPSTNYKARFDFDGITQSEADRLLPSEVRRAVDESIARMNANAKRLTL
jgi:hypothetical protein